MIDQVDFLEGITTGNAGVSTESARGEAESVAAETSIGAGETETTWSKTEGTKEVEETSRWERGNTRSGKGSGKGLEETKVRKGKISL